MAEAGYGLIGEKLGHSFSPYIHGELGGYDYSLDFYLMNGELQYVDISISVLSWSVRKYFVDL